MRELIASKAPVPPHDFTFFARYNTRLERQISTEMADGEYASFLKSFQFGAQSTYKMQCELSNEKPLIATKPHKRERC